MVSMAIVYFTILLGTQSDLYWILFVLSSVSILLFSFKDFKKSILLSFVPIFTWVFLEVYFVMGMEPLINDVDILNTYVHYLVIFLIIMTQTVFVYSFVKNNHLYLSNLNNKNEQLLLVMEANRQTTVELQEAYDSLLKSREVQIEMTNQVSFAKLVDGIAHEIKNPLHLIRARSELLFEKNQNYSNQEVHKFAASILKTIDRLTALMNPMLKYAKKDIEIEMDYFNLTELVDDLILLSLRKCQEEEIQLRKVGDFDYEVFADKNYIYQALMNVVVNAIQFTPKSGSISISATDNIEFTNPHGREVLGVKIEVADTGRGIPKEKLDTVFQPYITCKQSESNIGLGLSIVFRYITSNKGIVKINSKEGEGTVVALYIPKRVS